MVPWKRIILACGVLTALSFGASALPPCQQFVRVRVQQWERNRVTKRTQKRWDAWNKTHPHFQPHPRPAYRMTEQELTYKLNFDCPSPVPVSLDAEPFTPLLDLTPPETLETFTESPAAAPAIPSLTAALEVPAATPVPEPSSLLAVLTGVASLLCAALIERWKRTA